MIPMDLDPIIPVKIIQDAITFVDKVDPTAGRIGKIILKYHLPGGYFKEMRCQGGYLASR
jgi:hypothetical protein